MIVPLRYMAAARDFSSETMTMKRLGLFSSLSKLNGGQVVLSSQNFDTRGTVSTIIVLTGNWSFLEILEDIAIKKGVS